MNIAIVGAGLVGRVLALNLLREGHKLTLFDKDSKEGVTAAGFTAAGMLAPFAELETAESVIFELGKRSQQLWKSILRFSLSLIMKNLNKPSRTPPFI
jgi:glycine oxidase